MGLKRCRFEDGLLRPRRQRISALQVSLSCHTVQTFTDDSDLVLERGEGVDGPNLSLMVLMVRQIPYSKTCPMLVTHP